MELLDYSLRKVELPFTCLVADAAGNIHRAGQWRRRIAKANVQDHIQPGVHAVAALGERNPGMVQSDLDQKQIRPLDR